MLRRRPTRRLRAQSFHRLIPNIMTLTALSAGLTAVRFALEARWHAAIIAVLIAAVLDGLDGRIARLIGATSKFGAELDSLSDFICFGVVPGLISYLWILQGGSPIGWAAVLIYAVGAALRLARFNTALEDESRPPWTYNYFVGVPAPAAAGLALMPMVASLEFNLAGLIGPVMVGGWLILVAALMVSRIPTYAFKRVRIPNLLVVPMLLLAGIVAAGLATEPWLTLLILGGSYIVSIPLSIRSVMRLRRMMQRASPEPEAPPAA